MRLIQRITIFSAGLLVYGTPVLAQPTFLEVRRTFSSPHCDSGEIYIDGSLSSLFQSDPALFSASSTTAVVLTGELSTALFDSPGLFTGPQQSFVLTAADGTVKLRLAMLNGSTFTPFQKRLRKRQLGSIEIVLGYSVLNRKCEITASSSVTKYNDEDSALEDTSGRLGAAILSEPNLRASFPSSKKKSTVVVFTDRSHQLEMAFAGRTFKATYPVRGAEGIGADDYCLQNIEHMGNTIHRTSGVTYERRDDVVVCPTGIFDAGSAIEQRRDIRFISIQENAVCANILGLPLNRFWYIWRGAIGNHGPVYSNCTNQDSSKVADSAMIDIK